MDDSDKRGSDAAEQTPPKTKAEDNPWYLLATLYGVPEPDDHELRLKNRLAWNRYFAANLDEETRGLLVYEKGHPAEELTPFCLDELQEVEVAFAKRKSSAREMSLPASGAKIDFSNTEFDRHAFFREYPFTSSSFQGATFSGMADFGGATFSGMADFGGATFSGTADFSGATFSGIADFYDATFCVADLPFPAMPTFTVRPSPWPTSVARPFPAMPTFTVRPSPWPTSVARPSPVGRTLRARSFPAMPTSAARPSPAWPSLTARNFGSQAALSMRK